MENIKPHSTTQAKVKTSLNSLAQDFILKILAPMNKGQLKLTLPNGDVHLQGEAPEEHRAEMHVRDSAFFKQLILGGEIALGDTYTQGLWDSPDVTAVIQWFILNREEGVEITGSTRKGIQPINLLKSVATTAHRLRANTITNAKKNIEAHYDLSNPFYESFLDKSLTYSSAYFTREEETLEQAQENKIDRLLKQLDLKPGEHLLEIGSGWGALGLRAIEQYDVKVTSLTLSNEQFSHVQNLIRERGLEGRFTIELCDYRHAQGQFDKLVSVEMIEAVGHQFLPTFFTKCHQLLKSHGIMALQAIVFPHARYQEYLKGTDWIQKEIFPGGHLPSIPVILEGMARAGEFELRDLKDIGLHYARTLREWKKRFTASYDKIAQLGFDDTFMRKWNYYLSYCEAGFLERHISTAQLIFARPNAPFPS